MLATTRAAEKQRRYHDRKRNDRTKALEILQVAEEKALRMKHASSLVTDQNELRRLNAVESEGVVMLIREARELLQGVRHASN